MRDGSEGGRTIFYRACAAETARGRPMNGRSARDFWNRGNYPVTIYDGRSAFYYNRPRTAKPCESARIRQCES